MPKHPFIKKDCYELAPIRMRDQNNGLYLDGPVAGFQRLFDGAFVCEVGYNSFAHINRDKRRESPCFPFFCPHPLQILISYSHIHMIPPPSSLLIYMPTGVWSYMQGDV